MGDFSVDVTRLRALSGQLRTAADELGAALGELSRATPGQLGTGSLDEACRDFQLQWQHGMSLIRENVNRVGAGLDATAGAYQQHDQDIAQLFAGVLKPEGAPGTFPGLGHTTGSSQAAAP